MARIAITVAGAVVGGLIGAATDNPAGGLVATQAVTTGMMLGMTAGNLIGSLVDPQRFQGPRLSDLSVSSSANGAIIPWGYGTYRLGGNIIWSPGLLEQSQDVTAKGGPVETKYNYYASFAAAFGQGPAAILRVWGDTKVIYETGGPTYFPSKWFVAGSPVGWWGGICGAFVDSVGNLIEAVWVGHGSNSEGEPFAPDTFTVPAGATQFQLGINGNYQVLAAGGFNVNVSVNGRPDTEVYVPASAVPWEVVGAQNADYPFGNVGGTAPVLAAANLVAGDTVAVGAIPNGFGAWLGRITMNSSVGTNALGNSTGKTVTWYGPDGDTNVPTGSTQTAPPPSIYPTPNCFPGTEGQEPSALIQANEGIDNTPAFRGLCYGVWENLPLANFGNRIPNIRAEVSYGVTPELESIPNVVQYANATGCNGNITVHLSEPPGPNNTLIAIAMIAAPVTCSAGLPQGFVVPTPLTLLNPNGVYSPPWTENAPFGGGVVCGTAQVAVVGVGQDWMFPCPPFPYPYNWGGYGQISCTVIEVLGSPAVQAGSGAAGMDVTGQTTPLTAGDVNTSGPSLVIVNFVSYYDGEIESGSYTPSAFNSPSFVFDVAFTGFLSMCAVAGSDTLAGTISASLRSTATGAGGNQSQVVYSVITASFPDSGVYTTGGSSADLARVVSDICLRGGLSLAQVDVSRLAGQPVIGYVLGRPSTAQQALKPLAAAYFFDGAEIDGVLAFIPRGQSSLMSIPESDLGLAEEQAAYTESQGQEQDLPRDIQVTYLDPAIDYQQGKQGRRRSVRVVKTRQQSIVELPMALEADMAMQIAERLLYLAYLERQSFTISLWRASYGVLTPTDVIQFVGRGVTRQVRIVSSTEGSGQAITLTCVSDAPKVYLSQASGGAPQNYIGGSNQAMVTGTLYLFDIPLLRDIDANSAGTGFYFGMAAGAGFSGAQLYVSSDSETWADRSSAPLPLPFGTAANVLGIPISPWQIDAVNTLTIQLVLGSLASATLTQLTANNVNGLLVGQEIIQFETATQNSDGSWTVGGLLRGRRGTEGECGSHVLGESVVLLTSPGLVRVSEPGTVLGVARDYRAPVAGQTLDALTSQSFTIAGRDLMPYSPVNIGAAFDDENNLIISWTRRTRLGGTYGSGDYALCDGMNGPVSEQAESYQIDIVSGSPAAVVRTLYATTPSAVYSYAQQIADFGAVQASYRVNVYQMSAAVGRGFPGAATVPATGATASLPVSGTFYIN